MKEIVDELSKLKVARNNEFKISIKELSSLVKEARDETDYAMLVQHLIEFYAYNTNVFNVIISESLREEVGFAELSIRESVENLADAVKEGRVYSTPNGIFEAWTVPNRKKHSKKLSMEDAIEDASMWIHGSI